MIRIRVRYILFCFWLCSTLLPIIFLPSSSCSATVAPGRQVVIEQSQNQNKPPWKQLWDDARELFRKNDFALASVKYKTLLELKPNIEEAKWEFCKVLLETKQWAHAASLLESLIENDPQRIDYLVTAGNVALQRANYNQAIKYFGPVYESDPFGKYGVTALQGLIAGLEGDGKPKNAYLMMEQLYQRNGEDEKLLLRLGNTAQALGMLKDAKFYFSKLVKEFNVDDSILLQAALLHDDGSDSIVALHYFEKYLERDPHYLPFRKKAAEYYLSLDKKKSALPHLLKIYEIEGVEAESLLLIGRIYLYEVKRPDKALHFLEEYQLRYPGNKKIGEEISRIHTVLANNFLSIVENDGAWQLWRDLAQITPNRKAVYLAMAEVLERLYKEKELVEVLEIVHKHDPQDIAITFRIAKLYKKKKAPVKALKYFRKLKGNEEKIPQYLLEMADLLLLVGDEQKALDVYLQYLKQNSGNKQIRRKALKIAGDLGLVEKLKNAFGQTGILYSSNSNFSSLDRFYLDGLKESGRFTEADLHYKRLYAKISPQGPAGTKIRFHELETLLEREQIYHAEQIAREILADNIEVNASLEKLIEIAVRDNQISWAKSWFDLLASKGNIDSSSVDYAQWPEGLFFLYVDILIGEDNSEEAIDVLKEYLSQTRVQVKTAGKQRLKAYLALLRIYYENKEYKKCQRLAKRVVKKYPDNLEAVIISDRITVLLSKKNSADNISPIVALPDIEFTSLIERSSLAYRYGSLEDSLKYVDKALSLVPKSVKARLLKSKILTDAGNYKDALKLVEELHEQAPGEEYYELKALQLEYLSGNFIKIVEALPLIDIDSVVIKEEKSSRVSKEHLTKKRLILARSLWANKQWEAAIKVYKSLLRTPVMDEFNEKIGGEHVKYQLPPLKKSFWNVITFTHPEQPDPVTMIMKPAFVGSNLGKPIDQISASLYDKYRWQKLIESELAVRKAMKRRDYHEVEKEYQTLTEKGGAKDTLFDLAEVYGRLELYGKEAELYEEIREKGPDYPELNELERLNKIKRKPQILMTTEFSSRKGREGYVDIKKKAGGFEGWVMPTLRQELHLSYYRTLFSSTEREDTLWSNRFLGEYQTNLNDKLDFNVSLGAEDISEIDEYTILYNLEFLGKIHDKVTGSLLISQDIEDDTMEAIEQGIHFRNIEGGVSIDVVPRWFCGADLMYREYSDSNQQNMVRLWSSYNLFGESYVMRLKYKYENTTSSTPNVGRENLGLGKYAVGDHPYWSPSEYSIHKLMFHFKHLFPLAKSEDDILSNYTIDYSFGYESGSHVTQDASFQIFLEMSRHFLLKGKFTYESARDNKQTGVNLSLIYRW